MFAFTFEEALFKFQFDSPSFEPLFQLPPTIASTHPKTLKIKRFKRSGGTFPRSP
jgi:hypothetical protein